MATILVAMPERTYRQIMTPELEAALYALGEIRPCLQASELSEAEYGELWEQADAALTGWGVRPPTPAMLDRATHLQIISHTAGSVRMLPRYALEKGIVITSARAAIARTVAEYCLFSALLLLRRALYYLDADPARKAFLASDGSRPRSETLFGKTVGLIGFGCVGTQFRQLLAPFGCRVLVYDPYLSEEAAEYHQVERADLPALLQAARIVSLHAPDIPETRGLIGARELTSMPDGAIVINSARGRIVATEALTAELQKGRLGIYILH
ncbi:MAG TPA: NAD(P)-dependent oxidoreductase [Chthonomonadaceae bacterium]|nr:NAD(P)-dependent oxidoreductase [Chthonomonadaceae bacterium]